MIIAPPPYCPPLPSWWYLLTMLPNPETLKKCGELSLRGLQSLRSLAYEKGREHRSRVTDRPHEKADPA